MDGNQVLCLYSAIKGNSEALTNRGHGGCGGAFGVSLGETASIGDLGGNSKYSCENFED